MAVLLRQPEVYQGSLQSALRRARIPVFLAESAQLPHPQGRALLSLLECARENLSARRFAEYLSLARQLPTPYRWEELLGTAWVTASWRLPRSTCTLSPTSWRRPWRLYHPSRQFALTC